MLPLNVEFNEVKIKYSTAEVYKVEDDKITFRLTQARDEIILETKKEICPNEFYEVLEINGEKVIKSLKHAKIDEFLEVIFK